MTTAYEQGQKARRDGLDYQDNPYLGEPGRAGIRPYTDEEAGTAWTVGFRDENDAIYRAGRGLTAAEPRKWPRRRK